ncbi:MAG TPA: hypothetical protein VF092_14825 [Longimicrobium sp.]
MSARPLSARRVWLLATLALVLTFVAGALAGAAWERVRGDQPRRHRGPRAVAESMQRRYGLTDDQRRRIDAIMQRRRPRVDSLLASVRPQLRAAMDSTNGEIRVVLTPAQRKKFDANLERRRRGLDRMTGNGSQRGSPPSARP